MSTPRSNTRTRTGPPREPQPIIYSICIPRVFKNIGEKRIRAIMYSLKFGFVERVDMVAKKNEKGEEFSRVFVHFSSWNERSDSAMQVRAKLDSGTREVPTQVKIVYDAPWYWMISKSKTERPEQRQVRGGRPAPFIDFGHTATGSCYRVHVSAVAFLLSALAPLPSPHTPADWSAALAFPWWRCRSQSQSRTRSNAPALADKCSGRRGLPGCRQLIP
jgi:hypothetical protein